MRWMTSGANNARAAGAALAAWVLAVGSLVAAVGEPAAAAERTFRAGAFAQNIDPPEYPVSVNGGMADRQATRATDPLHARCLVLDDGRKRLAIVVCDSCMIPREVFDEAKQLASKATGIPPEQMLMSATHTHTAVTASGVFQSEPDPKYQRFLAQQIAKGVAQAAAQLEPAQIGWASGHDPTQVFIRRWIMKPGTAPPNPFGQSGETVQMNPGHLNPNLVEPAAKPDTEVSILAVRTPAGRPIALLANYSLHYVGGLEPLSADYFGAFAARIGERLGAQDARPAFVGIMSNGTSGDANNNNYGQPALPRPAPGQRIREVAESVSAVAYEAYGRIEWRDWVPLAAREREVELGVRLPSAEDLAAARALLAEAGPGPYAKREHIYARETVLLAAYPATVRARLQALRIGPLGIVSSPCETFAATGLAIKQASPLKPTFTIELANGYNGYLPTPEEHARGGYETWRARSSYLAVDAEPKIRATLLELLAEVAAVPLEAE